MLRGLLAQQTEMLQQSSETVMDDVMTKVRKLWEQGLDSVEAKLAAQQEAVQKLSDRCSMLEQRLQRLEDCDDGAGSAPTMDVAEVSDRCCLLEDGTGNASTMVENENQKSRKKEGRKGSRVAASCNGVDFPPQRPQKVGNDDMEVEKGVIEGDAGHTVAADLDLEPDDWDGAWDRKTRSLPNLMIRMIHARAQPTSPDGGMDTGYTPNDEK